MLRLLVILCLVFAPLSAWADDAAPKPPTSKYILHVITWRGDTLTGESVVDFQDGVSSFASWGSGPKVPEGMVPEPGPLDSLVVAFDPAKSLDEVGSQLGNLKEGFELGQTFMLDRFELRVFCRDSDRLAAVLYATDKTTTSVDLPAECKDSSWPIEGVPVAWLMGSIAPQAKQVLVYPNPEPPSVTLHSDKPQG